MFWNKSKINEKKIRKLISEGKFEDVINEITVFLNENPDDLDAYGVRGTVYIDLGKYEEALQDYNFILSKDPESVFVYSNRAKMYRDLENFELALNDINKAISIQPKWSDLYVDRGYINYRLGKAEQAENDFNEVIRLGNKMDGINNKAVLFTLTNQFDKAIEAWNKYLRMNKNDPQAKCIRGILFTKTGRIQEGITEINIALRNRNQIEEMYLKEAEEIIQKYSE